MKNEYPGKCGTGNLSLQSGYFRIEEGDPVNQLLYFVNKALAKGIVTAFIGLKPFPVIVLPAVRLLRFSGSAARTLLSLLQ